MNIKQSTTDMVKFFFNFIANWTLFSFSISKYSTLSQTNIFYSITSITVRMAEDSFRLQYKTYIHTNYVRKLYNRTKEVTTTVFVYYSNWLLFYLAFTVGMCVCDMELKTLQTGRKKQQPNTGFVTVTCRLTGDRQRSIPAPTSTLRTGLPYLYYILKYLLNSKAKVNGTIIPYQSIEDAHLPLIGLEP